MRCFHSTKQICNNIGTSQTYWNLTSMGVLHVSLPGYLFSRKQVSDASFSSQVELPFGPTVRTRAKGCVCCKCASWTQDWSNFLHLL